MESLEKDCRSTIAKCNTSDHSPVESKALTIVKHKDNSYEFLASVWGDGTNSHCKKSSVLTKQIVTAVSNNIEEKEKSEFKRQIVTGVSNNEEANERRQFRVDNNIKHNACNTSVSPLVPSNLNKVETDNGIRDSPANGTGTNIKEVYRHGKDKLLDNRENRSKDKDHYKENQTKKPNVNDSRTRNNKSGRPHKQDKCGFLEYTYKLQTGKVNSDKEEQHFKINNSGMVDTNDINIKVKEGDKGDNRENSHKHGDFSSRDKKNISGIRIDVNVKPNLYNTKHEKFNTKTSTKENIGGTKRLEKSHTVSRVVELNYTERHVISENYTEGDGMESYSRSHYMERYYSCNSKTKQINSKNEVGEQNKAYNKKEDTTTGMSIKVARDIDNVFQFGDDLDEDQVNGNGFAKNNELAESNNPNLNQYFRDFGQTNMYKSCLPVQTVSGSKGHKIEEGNGVSDIRQCDSGDNQVIFSGSKGHNNMNKTIISVEIGAEGHQTNASGSKNISNSDNIDGRCFDRTVGTDASGIEATGGNSNSTSSAGYSPKEYTEHVQNNFSSSDRKASGTTTQTNQFVQNSSFGSRPYSNQPASCGNRNVENQRSRSADDQNESNQDDQKCAKGSKPGTDKFCVTVFQDTNQQNDNTYSYKTKDSKAADHRSSEVETSTAIINKRGENQTKVTTITVKLKQTVDFKNLFNNKSGRKAEPVKLLNQKAVRSNKVDYTNLAQEKNLPLETIPDITTNDTSRTINQNKSCQKPVRSDKQTDAKLQTNRISNTKKKQDHADTIQKEKLLPTSIAEVITKDQPITTKGPTYVKNQTKCNSNNKESQARETTQVKTHFKDANTRCSFNDNQLNNTLNNKRDIMRDSTDKTNIGSGNNGRVPDMNLNPKNYPLLKSNHERSRKYMSRTTTRNPYVKDNTYGYHGKSFENQNKEAKYTQNSLNDPTHSTADTDSHNGATQVTDSNPLTSLFEGTRLLTSLAESAGLIMQDVQPDGNCMYRSVIDQLRIQGVIDLTAGRLRQLAVAYLKENPYHEDGTHLEAFVPTENWDDYLYRMGFDGEWGDQIMLRGISEVTSRKICIISVLGSSHNQTTIQPGKTEADQSESIFLGHINDYHYVSLRPKDWFENFFANADENIDFAEEHDLLDDCRATPNNEGHYSVPFPSTDECVDKITSWSYPHLAYIMLFCLPEPIHINHAKERRDIQEQFSIDTTVTFCGDLEQITFVYPQSGYIESRQLVYISPNIPNFVTFHEGNICENTKYLASEMASHPGLIPLIRLQHVRKKESSGQFSLLGNVPTSSVDKYDTEQFWHSIRLRRRPKTSAHEIYCFTTEEWPASAMKWRDYIRPSGWPDLSLVNEIMKAGCLIIPIPHNSNSPECEWKMCFANAEEKLMSTTTRSQKHCLYMFRNLVRFCLRRLTKFQLLILETVFFQACENIPVNQWQEKTIQCVLYLLDSLLLCLKKHVLSHYFVRDINLLYLLNKTALDSLIRPISKLRRCIPIAAIFIFKYRGKTQDDNFDEIIEDARQITELVCQQSSEHLDSVYETKSVSRHPKNSMHEDLQRLAYQQDMQGLAPVNHAYAKLIRSVTTIIVPPLVGLVSHFVQLNEYKAATLFLKEAFSCGKLVNVTEDAILIRLVIGKMEEFWLRFFMDHYYSTSMLKHFVDNYTERTSIKELVNDENNAGIFNDIEVPVRLMLTGTIFQGQGHDLDIDHLLFLRAFCQKLINVARFLGGNLLKQCQPYLRSLIKMIKGQLSLRESPATDMPTFDYESSHAGTRTDHFISNLKSYLRETLELLYFCYEEDGVPELFYEYVNDLENLCDEEQSVPLYQTLANIWLRLGERQKYLDVMEQIEVLNCTTTPY